MNFYKHHLGDYSAATSHLSWDEDCAYRRLIDAYYRRGGALPADVKECQRLARATTPAHRRAVEVALKEFFHLETDGWHQKRCDEEITKYRLHGDTNRRIAEQREAKKRALTVHEDSTNRDTNRAQTVHESSTLNVGEREPNQNPLTKSTSKEKEDAALPRPDDCWSVGIRVLSPVLEAAKARAFIGKLLRDYPEDTVKDALSEAEGSAEPRSYVNGILAKKPRKKGSSAEVEARYLEGLRGAI